MGRMVVIWRRQNQINKISRSLISTVRMNLLSVKLYRQKRNVCYVILQTAKVMATVCAKCMVKMKTSFDVIKAICAEEGKHSTCGVQSCPQHQESTAGLRMYPHGSGGLLHCPMIAAPDGR